MILFDASAWAGIWPFTATVRTSLADLVSSLQTVGISGAAVSPLNAVLGAESSGANLALIDEARSLPRDEFDLRVVPVLDPSMPGWERDLDQLVGDHADLIGAIRIVPNYHSYDVGGSAAIELARAVTRAGLGVCVQLRMLDERAHHPLMKVPGVPLDAVVRLAGAVPEARILACGMYQAELATIGVAPNISAELSSIESGDALANALAIIGEDRLLLGTHAPVYYPAPAVAKVVTAGVDEDTVIRVASFNAAAFFN